jgi:hypothetical protein
MIDFDGSFFRIDTSSRGCAASIEICCTAQSSSSSRNEYPSGLSFTTYA